MKIRDLKFLANISLGRAKLYLNNSGTERLVCFHHIPKCAGSSLLKALSSHYDLVRDYRIGWSNFRFPPVNLERMRAHNCLSGHFEPPEHQIFKRYPTLLEDDSIVFCFIREPFDLMCSLFRYEEMHGVRESLTFEDFLISKKDYLAKMFDVQRFGITDAIENYTFIGLFEHMDESVKRLAKLLAIDLQPPSHLNSSTHIKFQIQGSDREVFEEHFQTDIELYRECQKRFLAS